MHVRKMLRDQRGSLTDDLLVAAKAGEPLDLSVFAEPGELAFSVVAMALLGLRDGLFAADLAMEQGRRLRVAERGESATVVAVDAQKLRSLFYEARLEHLGGAQIDAGVEFGAGRIQGEAKNAKSGERLVRLLPLHGDG